MRVVIRSGILLITIWLVSCGLLFSNELYLNGINETTYIYRTAKDSLNSYFRDAFSFSLGYRDFTLGIKFLAELPKYSNDQNQLLSELNPNKLSVQWTERFLEFERDNLLLHGGTISESFGSGMIFRAWEDTEFDQDLRLDGFLMKYNKGIKLKALYGALPNRNQPAKLDLVYGVDGEKSLTDAIGIGASALTMRTLNALNIYNQQDVFGSRFSLNLPYWDGGVEYAVTSLYNNSGANHQGTGINAYTNIYLGPLITKSLAIGLGYKHYDKFNYRTQDLKTNTYHNETLSDNLITGIDEEGLQGSLTAGITDNLAYYVNYAEAWNTNKKLRMNDLYTAVEWLWKDRNLLFEYGHIEKINDQVNSWQKDLSPAINLSMPVYNYSFSVKAEYEIKEKEDNYAKSTHYEPMLQCDLGRGRWSLSAAAESNWKNVSDAMNSVYWVNAELKYSIFDHTDVTMFAGKEAGGKVCRNGVCRFVAPFKGLKLEATTRF